MRQLLLDLFFGKPFETDLDVLGESGHRFGRQTQVARHLDGLLAQLAEAAAEDGLQIGAEGRGARLVTAEPAAPQKLELTAAEALLTAEGALHACVHQLAAKGSLQQRSGQHDAGDDGRGSACSHGQALHRGAAR